MKKSAEKDLDALLSDIPDKLHASVKWTMQEDAAILKYAPSKGIPAIAKALGKTKGATQYRYNYLRTLVAPGNG